MTDSTPKLTSIERLILANQYRILAELNKKESEYYGYPNRIRILESGFENHYHEIFGSIAEPLPNELCTNVMDILNLFDAIYEATNGQPPEQLKFKGFDHNTEHEALKYAKFIKDCDRLRHIPSPVNSHESMMEIYLRMVNRRKEKRMPYNLTQEHLEDLINARRGPAEIK